MKKEATVIRSRTKSSEDSIVFSFDRRFEPFHLYVITDDKIKKDDWYYNKIEGIGRDVELPDEGGRTRTCYKFENLVTPNRNLIKGSIKKIIGTTDTKFHNFRMHEGSGKYWEDEPVLMKNYLNKPIVPQLPKVFIEEYCRQGGIGKVMVEYEMSDICAFNKCQDENCKKDDCTYSYPMVNKNNEIIIHPIKDSWSREEVIELCKLAHKNGWADNNTNTEKHGHNERYSIENWIKQNI